MPREAHCMLHGGVQVGELILRWTWTRGFQQIGNDAVDPQYLFLNVLHYVAGRAGGRQISPDNLHDASYAGQRIANFVCQSGSQFSQGRHVFGPRHLRAMQVLDLLAAFA